MKAKSGKYISFLPDNKNVLVSHEDQSVLEVALRAEIDLDHTCGGNGTCGTCRVFIEKELDKLESRNEIESEMALDRAFAENERLACQIAPVDGLVIRRPTKA